MSEQNRIGKIEGTPGWVIGLDPEGGRLELIVTVDDRAVVSTPMRRQDAIDLSAMLSEAVSRFDAGT